MALPMLWTSLSFSFNQVFLARTLGVGPLVGPFELLSCLAPPILCRPIRCDTNRPLDRNPGPTPVWLRSTNPVNTDHILVQSGVSGPSSLALGRPLWTLVLPGSINPVLTLVIFSSNQVCRARAPARWRSSLASPTTWGPSPSTPTSSSTASSPTSATGECISQGWGGVRIEFFLEKPVGTKNSDWFFLESRGWRAHLWDPVEPKHTVATYGWVLFHQGKGQRANYRYLSGIRGSRAPIQVTPTQLKKAIPSKIRSN